MVVLLGRVLHVQALRASLAMHETGSQSGTACAAWTDRACSRYAGGRLCAGQEGERPAPELLQQTPAWCLLWATGHPNSLLRFVPLISFCTTGACRDAPAPGGASAGAAVNGVAHNVQADTVGGQESKAGVGEQLAAKVQECESLRTKLRAAVKKGKAIEQQRDQLRQQVDALQAPQVGHTHTVLRALLDAL